jgi:hypothetical protein
MTHSILKCDSDTLLLFLSTLYDSHHYWHVTRIPCYCSYLLCMTHSITDMWLGSLVTFHKFLSTSYNITCIWVTSLRSAVRASKYEALCYLHASNSLLRMCLLWCYEAPRYVQVRGTLIAKALVTQKWDVLIHSAPRYVQVRGTLIAKALVTQKRDVLINNAPRQHGLPYTYPAHRMPATTR